MANPDIKAVIFDMDGLMLDTERVGKIAWQQAAQEWGYTISDEDHQRILGITVPDSAKVFRSIFGEDFPFEDIRERRLEISRAYYDNHGIDLKPGLAELLDYLESRGIARAVATSTGREAALRKLTATGLLSRFAAVIAGDDIENGKPAPDIFLAAAQKLNIPPERCLVLEDSEAGILAARRAGMMAIMVPDQKPPGGDVKKIACCIAPSLLEVRDILAKM